MRSVARRTLLANALNGEIRGGLVVLKVRTGRVIVGNATAKQHHRNNAAMLTEPTTQRQSPLRNPVLYVDEKVLF
jgi:hypothetical protein